MYSKIVVQLLSPYQYLVVNINPGRGFCLLFFFAKSINHIQILQILNRSHFIVHTIPADAFADVFAENQIQNNFTLSYVQTRLRLFQPQTFNIKYIAFNSLRLRIFLQKIPNNYFEDIVIWVVSCQKSALVQEMSLRRYGTKPFHDKDLQRK